MKKNKLFENIIHGIFLILGLITVGCVLLITVYLIISGIPAIKEIGLDDGSPESLKLLDFVMDKDEAGITAKAKAFKELVDRFVKAEVDKTFKSKGRNPNGGGGNNDEGGSNSDNSIAAKLGEQTAAINKASNDILKHYYGGDK